MQFRCSWPRQNRLNAARKMRTRRFGCAMRFWCFTLRLVAGILFLHWQQIFRNRSELHWLCEGAGHAPPGVRRSALAPNILPAALARVALKFEAKQLLPLLKQGAGSASPSSRSWNVLAPPRYLPVPSHSERATMLQLVGAAALRVQANYETFPSESPEQLADKKGNTFITGRRTMDPSSTTNTGHERRMCECGFWSMALPARGACPRSSLTSMLEGNSSTSVW